MSSIVVTGASSGIGRAVAKVLVADGYRVFAGVRSQEDATAIEAELGKNCHAIRFDVRDERAIADAGAAVTDIVGTEGISGLINNAGIAVAGPIEHVPIAQLREQFEVNVIGVVAVTQAFLPLLKTASPPGRVINISSISGTITYPFLGPYSASKFALEALSDAMRRELAVVGVSVSVIQPGRFATPIWEKSAVVPDSVPAASPYLRPLDVFAEAAVEGGDDGMAPERLGRLVAEILTTSRPRPRYLVTRRRFVSWIARRLPTGLLDRLMARRLGMPPPGAEGSER